MAHMESLWPGLAELPLVVPSCEYDRLHAVLAHDFQRVTTHVRLVGAGADGLGEDVSVHVEHGTLAARDAAHAAARGRVDACRLLRAPRDDRSVAQPPSGRRPGATSSASPTTRRSTAPRTSARRRFRRAWSNVKPSRIGSPRALFEVYARCARERRPMYGGGMGELGVGRGQIELLAALFHADAPNDVAPSAYNEDDPPGGLPASPLAPRPDATGLRWAA
jgi:hypothetical protein